MTLINTQPDGTTTTGREIEDFNLNLIETEANVADMREKAENIEKVVQSTRWALEQVSEVEDQATDFLATIKSMQFSLKISGKVGPLKLPSKFVGQVLERLEDVASAVRQKARALEKKIEDGGYIEKLERAEDKLDEVQEGLKTVEGKLANYATTAQTMIFAFDLVGEPLDGLEGASNSAATPINDILVPLGQTYNDLEAELQFLDDAFAAAEGGTDLFAGLADVARIFGNINNSLSFLKPPLEAIQTALSPVEWLLDAVGLVYDITVGPVIDFLLDKLGVTAILNKIGDAIASILPDADILDEMERRIGETFARVENFIDTLGDDINDYVEDITQDVVDALNALAPDALRFGDEDRNVIEGRTNGLDLLNGLEGNDTLYGYAQSDGPGAATNGDLFVASSGDDFNYGGAGTDWLLLRGTVADYQITQFAEGAPIVFLDKQGRWGREVAEGIEQFVFNDGVFTLQQLKDMGALSPAETNGNDLIIGTTGDDVIAPLDGSDTIDGRAGIDTYLIPESSSNARSVSVWLQRAIQDAAGKEYDGWAFAQGDRDYLDSIENVTIEVDGQSTVKGTDGNNVIVTSADKDIQEGLGGRDLLFGGDDDDLLLGGDGNDSVYGGAGRDRIYSGASAAGAESTGELVDGGEGYDLLSYDFGNSIRFDERNHFPDESTRAGPLRIDATRGIVQHMDGNRVVGTDTVVAVESIEGSNRDDTIVGAARADGAFDALAGGGGADRITTNGSRQIDGGNGDDMILLTEGGAFIDGGSADEGGDTLDLTAFGGVRYLIRNGFNQRVDYRAFGDFETERLGTVAGQVADRSLIQLFSGQFTSIENLLLSDGNDEFYGFGTARLEIFGAGGNDRMVRSTGNDGGAQARLHGGDGDDYIEFRGEGDEAYGDAGNDWLSINTSDNDVIIEGGSGDDYIETSRMDGVVHGGAGYDVLALTDTRSYRSEVDLLLGTAATYFVNRLNLDQDYVRITELSGIEEIIGGEELTDVVMGSNDGERILGRGDNDTLNGRGGADEIFGGDGDDMLSGGGGNDVLHGGAGNDSIVGGTLPDEIDTASYANARYDGVRGEVQAGDFGAVTVDLATGRATGAQGNDTLIGIENVVGSKSADRLMGDGRDNALSGGEGDDTLEGRDGDDVLLMGKGNDEAFGGAGNDTIIAGIGNATVDGGAGTDRLDFGALEGDITIDLNSRSYTANLLEDLPVWREGGGADERVWNATVLTPEDVIETEASFANDDDDLTRALPANDDPAADRFEVVFQSFETRYTGTFASIEEISTGAGDDTVQGTERGEWIGGGNGDDLLLGGGLRTIDTNSVQAQVFRLYQATLDRIPDTAGYDGWVAAIGSGRIGLQTATAGFVGSAEFQARYGALGNAGFVDQLYLNVLGREGDEAGRAGWIGRLEGGSSRSQVVLGFSESAEFKIDTRLTASAYETTDQPASFAGAVFRLYQATLDRTPDYAGLQGWTDGLADGRALPSIVDGFTRSTEFQNTYGALNDRDFVNLLYRNVLGRDADLPGLNGWLDRLDDGMSRSQVVLGFSQSAEFIFGSDSAFVAFMDGIDGDTVRGGQGDDMLAGELASDHFVFHAADLGRDAVLSLDRWDDVSLLDFGYADADAARAKMIQAGQDVLFADQGVVVSFNGTTLAEMQEISLFV